MHLYHLTLQKESCVNSMCFGSFTGPKKQEIVVSRGRIVDLVNIDDDGKVNTIHSVDTFSWGTFVFVF